MESNSYKEFAKQASSGIKGEAFFELWMTDYSLPHRVVRSGANPKKMKNNG